MDIDRIKELVQLMVDNDLSRVEIQEGETHILLRRGQPVLAGSALPTYAAPAAMPISPASAPAASAAPAEAGNEIMIRSPMVGTFYAAPEPESPPYIKVGDQVGPETVVCLVEAMKVFNEIKAEVSGRVAKVFVKSGEAVEFDQPLFAVTPA